VIECCEKSVGLMETATERRSGTLTAGTSAESNNSLNFGSGEQNEVKGRNYGLNKKTTIRKRPKGRNETVVGTGSYELRVFGTSPNWGREEKNVP